jgi:dihydroorotate dehydrogenase (NAD+) catalytic subunit
VTRSAPDLSTTVGSVALPNPVMTASGTVGHGTELASYLPFDELGAVVVKSLAPWEWAGNPAPRLHPTPAGMLNAVGLQGPGVERWMEEDLPALQATGARIVASIWGRSIADYAKAAELLSDAPDAVVAVEVNVSCPNVEDRGHMFAHSTSATTEALLSTVTAGRPRWAKLSPNVTDLVEIADAAQAGGAEAVTLINTVMGMVIDVDARRPALGNGGGGLSGPAIRPVAVRAVWDVHAALPDLPIVGVGGVASADDALQLVLAGASAVQVGTATFADPRAPRRVLRDLERWVRREGAPRMTDLVGSAHRTTNPARAGEEQAGDG